MEYNTCTMQYYDWNWNVIEEDCIVALKDSWTWNEEISKSYVWYDTEISEELPYIYSFWYHWHEKYDGNWDDGHDWTTTRYWNGTHIFDQEHWYHGTSLYKDIEGEMNPACKVNDPTNTTEHYFSC